LPASARLEWRQADALALPFDDATFDVVLCQFGVMFFPDKVRGYAEARRVLRPGGRLLFNVWDRIQENDFTHTVTEALATLYPDDPPRFMARVPHGYADVERIRGELERAGFSAISSEARAETSSAASAHDAARAHCEGSPLRNELEARTSSTLIEATEHAAKALAERFGTGPISGRIRAFVFEATA
jgi:SAM-dependent methyltransferase